MSDSLLTTAEAAALLGVSKYYLERDRWRGADIPFVRIGGRMVRYRRQDLDRYIREHLRYSTADPGR